MYSVYLRSFCPRGGTPGHNKINEWAADSLYEQRKHQRREKGKDPPHGQFGLVRRGRVTYYLVVEEGTCTLPGAHELLTLHSMKHQDM